jgi:DNA-binding response OmpR family regulator
MNSHGFQGVILKDIMMPHMDGWQTIREIVARGYTKGNIISMLTARGDFDPIAEDIRPYVKDYLVKPFDLKPLVNKVKKYFNTQDLHTLK